MTAAPTSTPASAESLGIGAFAGLAYRLGRARATGVLTVYPPCRRPDVMVLRRGHLIAADTDALGRQTGRRLSHLASMGLRYTFDSDTVAYPPGAVNRQFSLAAWARSYFESQLDTQLARSLVTEFTGLRLSVDPDRAPEPGLCDATDLRILEALAQPSRLDEIWHHARTPRFRLLSFLYFLRCIDALKMTGAAVPRAADDSEKEDAWRLLGVTPDTDRDSLKRAYRRLARALHPDLHPHASESHRRRLERQLAAITSAYVRLTSSTAG